MHASLRKDSEVQHVFLLPPPVSFHKHRDLSGGHEPDKADDLHFGPGDIIVEKTAEHMMPSLSR